LAFKLWTHTHTHNTDKATLLANSLRCSVSGKRKKVNRQVERRFSIETKRLVELKATYVALWLSHLCAKRELTLGVLLAFGLLALALAFGGLTDSRWLCLSVNADVDARLSFSRASRTSR